MTKIKKRNSSKYKGYKKIIKKRIFSQNIQVDYNVNDEQKDDIIDDYDIDGDIDDDNLDNHNSDDENNYLNDILYQAGSLNNNNIINNISISNNNQNSSNVNSQKVKIEPIYDLLGNNDISDHSVDDILIHDDIEHNIESQNKNRTNLLIQKPSFFAIDSRNSIDDDKLYLSNDDEKKKDKISPKLNRMDKTLSLESIFSSSDYQKKINKKDNNSDNEQTYINYSHSYKSSISSLNTFENENEYDIININLNNSYKLRIKELEKQLKTANIKILDLQNINSELINNLEAYKQILNNRKIKDQKNKTQINHLNKQLELLKEKEIHKINANNAAESKYKNLKKVFDQFKNKVYKQKTDFDDTIEKLDNKNNILKNKIKILSKKIMVLKPLNEFKWYKKISKVRTLNNHNKQVFALSFNKSSRFLISGGTDNKINIWDTKKADLRNHFPIFFTNSHVKRLKCSPTEEKFFISANANNTIKLWDLNKNEPLLNLQNKGSILIDICFSPDGNTIAANFSNGIIKLWDRRSKQITTELKCEDEQSTSLAFGYQGLTLTSSSSKLISIWDIKQQIIICKIPDNNFINDIDFNPCSPIVVSLNINNYVKLWDIKNKRKIRHFSKENSLGNVIRFSPDGETIAIACQNGSVELHSTNDKKKHILKELIKKAHKKSVNNIVFSPNNDFFATCSENGKVKLWTTANHKLID